MWGDGCMGQFYYGYHFAIYMYIKQSYCIPKLKQHDISTLPQYSQETKKKKE